jgi:hypothetical protein
MKRLCLTAIFLTLAVGCSLKSGQLKHQVHVLLNDGQVLVGEMTTPTFTLKTQLGTLKFDSEDAGELGPLEGKDMQQSDNLVRLWLRNGSEFVGSWEHPAVQVEVEVGGDAVAVDVPIAKVKRLRFKGGPEWSDKPLYRVLTSAGDDFFVDASASRIHFQGELGIFSPFLSEISRLERLGEDADGWGISLKNGSRLHGGVHQDGVELEPTMGPDKVKLDWKLVARMEPASMHAPKLAAPEKVDQGFYDNQMQKRVKASAAQTWKH